MFFRQTAFHRRWQVLFEPFRIPSAVQQERTAVLEPLHHIVLVDVRRGVASDEIRRTDQVRRADRLPPKAQVRLRQPARFFGIVIKIRLRI